MHRNGLLRKNNNAHLWTRIANLALAAVLLAGLLVTTSAQTARAATLFSADFNSNENGFVYQDDAFGTSQPTYANGVRQTSGCYGGNGGCLQTTLGGINANAISGMSGGWSYTLNLASAESGVMLTFRYTLDQTANYEYDEYTRMLVKVDGMQYGRGTKNYVDHIGGDGASSQGNSNTFLPTTGWQQAEIYLGNLAAGNHTITLGGINNKKDAADESTTIAIDDVSVTSGNAAPNSSAAQTLAGRVSLNQYLTYDQALAAYHDRCSASSIGCSTQGNTTNYMNALAYVESQLQAMGYTTTRHSFNYNGNTGTNLWATKLGATTPTQMYMLSGHLDARSGGDGFDDDGSGVSLVLEAARVFAGADVTTDKSIRFIVWDREESGLYGAYGYVQDRRSLQGTTNEPTWLGLIQHDMIMYDHGAGSATTAQSAYADMDVEWRAGTAKEADSKALALKWTNSSGLYAPDYPSTAYDYSTNTDDTPFQPYVASVSVRENRRSLTSGTNAEWINPYYHTTSDVEASYTRDDDGDGKRDDLELATNTVRTTVGLVAELAGAQIVNHAPVANPQSLTVNEDSSINITLTGSDADGNPLTYSMVTNPGHGSLSGTAPSLAYTPAANYNGLDSFTFKVNDGTVDSPPATVSITVNPVNDPPVATPQTVATNVDTALAIVLSGADIDGDPLTFQITTGPTHGSLSGSPPNVTYTPSAGYSGSDSFQFVANDGSVSSAPASISITIQAGIKSLPFIDDFETDQGWTVNPDGSDSASAGQWERANPQGTDFDGPKQLDIAASETNALVTGALAGSNANSFDLDGGVTTIRSPLIQLPSGQEITLAFQYYLAYGRNASAADSLRVKVIGSTSTTVLEVKAANLDVDAAWQPYQVNLNSFAGQIVQVQIEAADAYKNSLVEAAIDDLSLTARAASGTLLSANFDAASDGFAYQDNAFRSAQQASYASGAYLAGGGHNGGGLQVLLGGLDTEIIQGMSGGWEASFNLAAPGNVTITFWYQLTQSSEYESEEFSQALIALDGVLYGANGNDFVAQVNGNGNGGISETTGWQIFSVNLANLAAGNHTLAIGGYNNQKTWTNETTEVIIDQVTVIAH